MTFTRTLLLPLLILLCASAGYGQKTTVVRFSTPNSKVVVAPSPDLNFPGDFTIEMWLFVSAHANQYNNLVEKREDAYSVYILQDGRINAAIATPGNFFEVTSADALLPLIWYHLAMVYDQKRGLLKLFVNGKPNGAINVAPADPIEPSDKELVIGGATQSASAFMGYLDEVRLCSAVKYTTDFDPKVTVNPDTSTVVLFRFDEGSGNTTADWSRKGHEGILTDVIWTSLPITGIARENNAPAAVELGANHPNPFTHSTAFDVSLPAAETPDATLRIVNTLGQVVADYTFLLRAGRTSFEIPSGMLPNPGIYYSVLRTDSRTAVNKIVFVR